MATMYANMQPQEELAALFSRNLTLNPMSQPTPAPAPAPVEAPQEERKIIYISQHYNHSAHIVRPVEAQPSRPASEPPQSEHALVERVLREHSVDPSGLSSAQLQLFKTVDTPEQRRLIELWRVCPPTNSTDNPTLAWGMTTVDQEEALARMRYEQQQQQQLAQQQQQQQQQQEEETIMSLDGTPLTPIQAGDGRWIATAEAHYHHDMEPYMAQGYEEMARREYEESARRAFFAEAVLASKGTTTNSVAAVPMAAGAGAGVTTFNPAHADPVYGMGWGREAQMADRYGRVVGMREDEEML